MQISNQIPIPELYVSAEAAARLAEEAAKLPRWTLNPPGLCDLELLMNGGFFPLKGFMTEADVTSVEEGGRLTSGALWPVPVTLEVSEDFAARIAPGDDIALCEGADALAILSVTDLWRGDGAVRLGGKVKGLRPPSQAGTSPNQLRALFARDRRDCVRVTHDCADLPDADNGLLLVQPLPPGAVPPEQRALLRDALAARGDVCLAPLNLRLRGAGTARAVFLGIVARNHGITHVAMPDAADLRDAWAELGLRAPDQTQGFAAP